MSTSTKIPNRKLKLSNDQELDMSYAMLNEVLRIVGNHEETVELMLTDANVRGLIIRRLFTDNRKPVDNIDELINPFEIDLDILEIDSVIAWVVDHVMHFTSSAAAKTRPVVEKYLPKTESPPAS